MRLRDISNSSLTINCFDAHTMTTGGESIKPNSMQGYIYKEGLEHAKKICDIVSVIIDEIEHRPSESKKSPIDSSIIEKMEKLAALKEKGVIDDAEFVQMKSTLMNDSFAGIVNVEEERAIEADEIPQEIKDAIISGQKLLAMTLYIDYKGCSLSEAKFFVDNYR